MHGHPQDQNPHVSQPLGEARQLLRSFTNEGGLEDIFAGHGGDHVFTRTPSSRGRKLVRSSSSGFHQPSRSPSKHTLQHSTQLAASSWLHTTSAMRREISQPTFGSRPGARDEGIFSQDDNNLLDTVRQMEKEKATLQLKAQQARERARTDMLGVIERQNADLGVSHFSLWCFIVRSARNRSLASLWRRDLFGSWESSMWVARVRTAPLNSAYIFDR